MFDLILYVICILNVAYYHFPCAQSVNNNNNNKIHELYLFLYLLSYFFVPSFIGNLLKTGVYNQSFSYFNMLGNHLDVLLKCIF